jgi:hypothetical protein
VASIEVPWLAVVRAIDLDSPVGRTARPANDLAAANMTSSTDCTDSRSGELYIF